MYKKLAECSTDKVSVSYVTIHPFHQSIHPSIHSSSFEMGALIDFPSWRIVLMKPLRALVDFPSWRIDLMKPLRALVDF